MKRVIRFSKARYLFFAVSLAMILCGAGGYIVNRGFNLGVDFKAGISITFQIAPASFSIEYTGEEQASITIPTGEQALTSPGNFLVSVTNPHTGIKDVHGFKYSDYATIGDLADALEKIPGIKIQSKGDMTASPSRIVPPVGLMDITGKSQIINIQAAGGGAAPIDISEIRAVLDPMGRNELQVVGNPVNQQFMVRFEAPTEEKDFQISTQNKLREILGAKYGADSILIFASNFVGAQMAQSLATQTIWLVLIAIFLILIYMMLRFRPVYAIAAVLGVLHDALIMLSFGAVFRWEMDAGTIAAILTILGYSINDTIVNFDRARENLKIMRGSSLRTILDTSVSQTLGRTFITSGATLITVVALFVLTTGMIRNFGRNMIVGILEGTYSTFISAFLVIEWTNWREKARRKREMSAYGVKPVKPEEELEEEEEPENVPVAEPIPALGEIPVDETAADGARGAAAPPDEAPEAASGATAGAAPMPNAALAPNTPRTDAAAGGGTAASQSPQAQADRPVQGKVFPSPGGSGKPYRYLHKRHKRRRH